MQQQRRRRSRLILGFLSLGLLAGAALTGSLAQAASGPGPYYAEPAWDQSLACPTIDPCPRFLVLTNWGSNAVLDKETGLVWEKSPKTTTHTWTAARVQCNGRTTGNRKGWRLPSMPELTSLMDPSVAFPGPMLPPGHPFTTVQSADYWSATTSAEGPTVAWGVGFNDGHVFEDPKTGVGHAWCVRGGMNADAY